MRSNTDEEAEPVLRSKDCPMLNANWFCFVPAHLCRRVCLKWRGCPDLWSSSPSVFPRSSNENPLKIPKRDLEVLRGLSLSLVVTSMLNSPLACLRNVPTLPQIQSYSIRKTSLFPLCQQAFTIQLCINPVEETFGNMRLFACLLFFLPFLLLLLFFFSSLSICYRFSRLQE